MEVVPQLGSCGKQIPIAGQAELFAPNREQKLRLSLPMQVADSPQPELLLADAP